MVWLRTWQHSLTHDLLYHLPFSRTIQSTIYYDQETGQWIEASQHTPSHIPPKKYINRLLIQVVYKTTNEESDTQIAQNKFAKSTITIVILDWWPFIPLQKKNNNKKKTKRHKIQPFSQKKKKCSNALNNPNYLYHRTWISISHHSYAYQSQLELEKFWSQSLVK